MQITNYKLAMVVGVISDTHGLLRPEALEALRGSDIILHAGDIGAPEILTELRRLAPVHAIRGNVDVQAWAASLPAIEVVEAGGLLLYMLHNLKELDLKPRAAGFAAVISGHSHVPGHKVRDEVLFFNPGSAGPRRFHLPISVGKLTIADGHIVPEIIKLG